MLRASAMAAGVVMVLGSAATRGAAADPAHASELKIGLAQPMFRDVPAAMVNAAAKPFQTMIQDKAGVKGSVEVVSDYTILVEKMKAGKLDICVFHGYEFAWVKDTPGLVPMCVTVPNAGKIQVCLVVNTESKARDARDLKGACVLVPRGTKGYCHMFLDQLRDKCPPGCCCPAKPSGLTPEDALAEVAAGTAEAALVDLAALNSIQKEYPASFNKLRVLAQSEELPSAVVVYRKTALDEAAAARVRKGLLECVKTPIGKTFALFWQLKGFEDVTPRYNDLLEKTRKVYPAPARPEETPDPSAPAPK